MPTNLKWQSWWDFCSAVLTNQLHRGSVLESWLFDIRLEFVLKSNFQSAKKLLSSLCRDSTLFIQWGVATPCLTFSGESRLHAALTVGSRDFTLHIHRKVATPCFTYSGESQLHASLRAGCRDFTLHLQREVATPCFTYSRESRLHASYTVWSRNFMLHLQRVVATLRFTCSGESQLHASLTAESRDLSLLYRAGSQYLKNFKSKLQIITKVKFQLKNLKEKSRYKQLVQ